MFSCLVLAKLIRLRSEGLLPEHTTKNYATWFSNSLNHSSINSARVRKFEENVYLYVC